MKLKFIGLSTTLLLTSACGALIGSTGQDTSFERQGTLNCATSDPEMADLVMGTEQDPARCGPQAQPIPR